MKNMTGYKMEHFKGKSFYEVKEMFNNVYKQVTSFVPMVSVMEKERTKRAGLYLQEESSKRQKTREGSEPTEELKADETSQEDLQQMIMVVPVEEVYVEALQRLFGPDTDDIIWKLQRYMHDPLTWRLYDTCGVHHVSTNRGHDIFMLVEKDYLLTRGLLTLMLCNKLQVDQYSKMADELLRKIVILANRPRRVPYDQRINPHQHPRIVYPSILDINYFRHFLDILRNYDLMDDEPMWAADHVVAPTLGSAITIPETTNEFAIKEEAKFMQTFFTTRFYNDYRDRDLNRDNWCSSGRNDYNQDNYRSNTDDKSYDLQREFNDFMKSQQSTNAFIKETFMDLKTQLKTVAKNHQALIQNLETKFDRLVDKQSGRPSGSLPSNTQPNPRGSNSKAYQLPQYRNEHVNAVFTRSGKSYDPPDNLNDQQNKSENPINFDSDNEDDEPTPQPETQLPKPVKETPLPKPYKPKIPYPQRLRKEKMEA
ncbi:hypothetical protein Tco_0307276 [Tanacetum coccineum]